MIDPLLINTVRVGELPLAPFELTDLVPHEIGDTLFQGTVQQLGDVIGDYLGSLAGIAFNPTTVVDGGTLPATTTNEWMLVGSGTFNNVGGGATIICTEELNALTSNGTYWSLSVEIPINFEFAGITQNIRSGYTETAPSEDVVFNALAGKADIDDIPTVPPAFPVGIEYTAVGGETSFDIGTTSIAHMLFWNGVPQSKIMWDQSGTLITLNFTSPLTAGDFLQMI